MEQPKTATRYSKKREAILDTLQGTHSHPSAEWLFQNLKPKFPDLSLGTVYRNLAFFQEQGKIKSVGVVNGQERFDADVSEHCHFICQSCGKVVDLHPISTSFQHEVEQEYGFSVTRQELILYGHCDSCQKTNTVLQ